MCQQDVTPASSCNLGGLDFSFQGVGGTSVSAPAFAGIMALVNQKQATSQVPRASPRRCQPSPIRTRQKAGFFFAGSELYFLRAACFRLYVQ